MGTMMSLLFFLDPNGNLAMESTHPGPRALGYRADLRCLIEIEVE